MMKTVIVVQMKRESKNPEGDYTRRKFLVGTAAAVAAAPFVGTGRQSARGAGVNSGTSNCTFAISTTIPPLLTLAIGRGTD
jgi:hypothetical protein